MKNIDINDAAFSDATAREDFYFFARYMFFNRNGYKWQQAKHHQQICDALMRVYSGECKRLIINIPPRYSKTILAMIYFMAWTLGRNADAEFIHTSYSARLASTNSWQTRELVSSAEYQKIFPNVKIKQDSTARDEWRTTAGGCVYAVGSGGAITGYGAGKVRAGFGGALLLDDPHKADEARSEIMRQNVIDWFQNTLESRKNSPDTPIILIMQRLHEKDLSGWLLDGGNGEQWEHLCLAAIQPDDSALWPEKHSLLELKRMRDSAPYIFAGQYQQSPTTPEGNIFKPDNIGIIDTAPSNINTVRAWDFASSVDGDWTAGVKMGIHAGRYIITDVVRLRGTPDTVNAALKNTADRDGTRTKIRVPQDPGQAGKQQVSFFSKMLSGFTFRALPVSGDKITRAEPFASQVNVGNVDMVRATWNDTLVDELRVFPNGTWDDQVDAASDAFAEVSEPIYVSSGQKFWK